MCRSSRCQIDMIVPDFFNLFLQVCHVDDWIAHAVTVVVVHDVFGSQDV